MEGCSPDCKPVSVPLRVIAIRLGRPLLTGSSSLPGSQTQRAAAPPLFGLAPRGVYHAGNITAAAVRSYRTFSPLPLTPKCKRRYILCGTCRKRRLEPVSPAVSRRAALWRPDFPPAFASGYPSGEHPSFSVNEWATHPSGLARRSCGWPRLRRHAPQKQCRVW
jgi:hypothetical protein